MTVPVDCVPFGETVGATVFTGAKLSTVTVFDICVLKPNELVAFTSQVILAKLSELPITYVFAVSPTISTPLRFH